MTIPKSQVTALLENMPENIDPEDLEYKLYVLKKLARGDADIATGRGYTTDEILAEIDRWHR